MITEPHWLVKIVIGVCIGLSVPYIFNALRWPLRFFRPHSLKGKWWEYHCSVKDQEVQLFEGVVTIRSGFRHDFVCTFKQIETELNYKGYIVLEQGSDQFLMHLKLSELHNEENNFWRVLLPLQSNSQIMRGIGASLTHDKVPYATILIMSREQLPEERVREMLSDIADISYTDTLIQLKR